MDFYGGNYKFIYNEDRAVGFLDCEVPCEMTGIIRGNAIIFLV